MDYDVIVAGASFAGLAVATNLKGKVLLIDRKSVGSVPISACVTLLPLLEKNNLENSILQVVSEVEFITAYDSINYQTLIPFATFDYKTFCQSFFARYHGDFKKENIIGFDGENLITETNTYRAKIFVDATGWRAKLASFLNNNKNFSQGKLGFGLETVVNYSSKKLSFVYDSQVIKGGYAWIFPIGKKSRIGLGTYNRVVNLLPNLRNFVKSLGFEIGEVHGGFMPYGLRRPTIKNLFLVGDSAGQIIPLTGEGIRQALYFGKFCGKTLQEVLEGKISLEMGLKKYHQFVFRHRNGYLLMESLQKVWTFAPNIFIDLISKVLGRRKPCSFFQRLYFDWMKF